MSGRRTRVTSAGLSKSDWAIFLVLWKSSSIANSCRLVSGDEIELERKTEYRFHDLSPDALRAAEFFCRKELWSSRHRAMIWSPDWHSATNPMSVSSSNWRVLESR